MRNIITVALLGASLGLATAASAQSAYDSNDGQVVTGRSAGSSVQFDGYTGNFGYAGGSVYPGSQTRTGGPSGAPNQNGG